MRSSELKELERNRRELQRLALWIEDKEAKLIDELDEIGEFNEGGYRASVTRETVPVVLDWDALTKHISRSKMFEILQKRVNTEYYRELVEGYKVPGISEIYVKRISISYFP